MSVARLYRHAQDNIDTVRDNVLVFVSDSEGPDDEPQMAIGIMDGRIVEFAIDDTLIQDFYDDHVSLATYVNTMLWAAFDAYSQRVGEYIQDGIV